jgi:hypothetical protein
LRPTIVYVGTTAGRIAKTDIPRLERHYEELAFVCQKSGWCDMQVMNVWMKEILRPYVLATKRRCIILLDSFKVHKLSSVRRYIEDLGCTIMYIPPGTTGRAQVLDVGINKPFKNL